MKNNMKNQILVVMSLLLTAAAFTSATLPAHADDTVANPATTPATTQLAAPVAAPDEAPWQFGITVPIWIAGIDGNATVLGHQQNVNISFDQLKDHLDASLALGLDVSKGKFGLYGDFMYMKFSGGFTGPLGGNTSADLKFVLANAGVSYRLLKTGEEHPFILAGTAGIRYWYADTTLTFRGPRGVVNLNGGNTYNLVDPVIGLRGSQYLTRKLHLDFSGDIGGFDISHDTDITWSATGVLTYDFVKWFSLSAGYQAVALDVANGSGASKNGVNLIFNGVLIALKVKF
jgi:hypothetical protein